MTTTQIYDRFQKPLRPGDIVLLLGKGDVFWRVVKAAPSFQPGAQIGAVELEMVAVWRGALPGGTPIADLIVVRPVEAVEVVPAGPVGVEHLDS